MATHPSSDMSQKAMKPTSGLMRISSCSCLTDIFTRHFSSSWVCLLSPVSAGVSSFHARFPRLPLPHPSQEEVEGPLPLFSSFLHFGGRHSSS